MTELDKTQREHGTDISQVSFPVSEERSQSGLLTDAQIDEYAVRSKEEIPRITPELVEAISMIDQERVDIHTGVDLVGVIAGIKPASIVDV